MEIAKTIVKTIPVGLSTIQVIKGVTGNTLQCVTSSGHCDVPIRDQNGQITYDDFTKVPYYLRYELIKEFDRAYYSGSPYQNDYKLLSERLKDVQDQRPEGKTTSQG